MYNIVGFRLRSVSFCHSHYLHLSWVGVGGGELGTELALLLLALHLLLLLLALAAPQLLATPIDDGQLTLDGVVGLAQVLDLLAQNGDALIGAEGGI